MKTNTLIENKWIAYISLAVTLLLWLYVAFNPQSSFYGYGGADNVLHYQLSRYAFAHPELFFYHWGKPLFTILSSPFAQFGIRGVSIFNIIVSLASCWFTWRIALMLKFRHSALVIAFAAFTPVFFFSATSSLTEPLFALFAIAGAYAFIRKKYIAAAIIFSLTIFIRSESLVLFPVYILALLIVKQWKALPFLLTGFLVISLAGFPFHGDFFWFFTKMPYSIGSSIYGSGSILHFVKNYKEVFGLPLAVFVFAGGLYFLLKLFTDGQYRKAESLAHLAVICGIPLVFFAAHSWVWYKGMGGSMGLLRVMVCVVPFFAVIGIAGYNFILQKILNRRVLLSSVLFLLMFVFSLFFVSRILPGFVIRAETSEKLHQETMAYIRNEGLDDRKIYFFNPLVPMFLDKDPWSENMHSIRERIDAIHLPEPGDIYIWDAHLGPNEGETPLDSLMKRTDFKLLMCVMPAKPYNDQGEFQYAVYTFMKLPPEEQADNYSIASDKTGFLKKRYKFSAPLYAFSFEGDDPREVDKAYINEDSGSLSNNVFCFSEEPEFLGFFEVPYSQISEGRNEMTLLFECSFRKTGDLMPRANIVVTVEKDAQIFFYEASPVDFTGMSDTAWTSVQVLYHIQAKAGKSHTMKCYIWNRSKTGSHFCIDDVKIYKLETL